MSDYEPLAEALSALRLIALEAGMQGCGAREIANELRDRLPDLVILLERQLLTDWVRRQLNRMKGEDGLPLFRSVGEKYVMRPFWGEDAYREVIGRYVQGSQQSLLIARSLADEAYRILGVRIPVPELRDQIS